MHTAALTRKRTPFDSAPVDTFQEFATFLRSVAARWLNGSRSLSLLLARRAGQRQAARGRFRKIRLSRPRPQPASLCVAGAESLSTDKSSWRGEPRRATSSSGFGRYSSPSLQPCPPIPSPSPSPCRPPMPVEATASGNSIVARTPRRFNIRQHEFQLDHGLSARLVRH